MIKLWRLRFMLYTGPQIDTMASKFRWRWARVNNMKTWDERNILSTMFCRCTVLDICLFTRWADGGPHGRAGPSLCLS